MTENVQGAIVCNYKGREKGSFCDVSIFEVHPMFVRDYCTRDTLGTAVVRKVRNISTSYASRDVAQNSLFCHYRHAM